MFNISVLALGLVLLWQQPAPRPAFRSEVNYVELDVSVLNRDGSRVRGLSKDDFEVFESGKPQTVSVFSEVHLPLPPAIDRRSPRRLADPGVASNAGLTEGRVYLIIMDYGTLVAEGTPQVKRKVSEFIMDFLGPNDLASIVSLGSTARSTEFTANKARLLAALNVTSEFLGSAEDLAKDATPTPTGLKHDGDSADTIAAYTDMEASQQATLTVDRFQRFGSLAGFLKGFQGRRKAVIYVSQGVDVTSSTGSTGGGGLAQNAVAGSMRDLTETLIDSGATVYAIDPRGLASIDPFDGGGSSVPLSRSFGPKYLGKLSFLRIISEDTGGFGTVGFNNLTDPYRRIVEDMSSYYVLGYESDRKLDGEMHSIRVRVRGRDLEVRTRAGILAKKPAALKADDGALMNAWRGENIASLLARPLPSGDLGLAFRATASAIGVRGRDAVVQLSVEVDGQGFTFAPAAGIFTDSIDVAFQALDSAQTVKAAKSETVALTLRPDTRDAVVARGWRYVTEFTVPPGLYQLRIAAAEKNGHHAGSVFLDVPVPDITKTPLAITGLAVTSQNARLVPTAGNTPSVRAVSQAPITASRTFNVTDTLSVLAGVVDAAAGDRLLSANAQLRSLDGKIAVDVPMSMRTAEVRADAAPHVFTLALKDVAPGDYDVVVRVADGAKNVSRSLPITVVR